MLRRIGQISLVFVGVFFLFFGVHVLISAYRLKDPFSFVLTFFSSNLIILISGALLAGFIVRIWTSRGDTQRKENNDNLIL